MIAEADSISPTATPHDKKMHHGKKPPNRPLFRFILLSLIVPALALLFRYAGLLDTSSDSALTRCFTVPLSMGFSSLILYGVIVNPCSLEALGIKKILLVVFAASVINAVFLQHDQTLVQFRSFGNFSDSHLRNYCLFSLLPALLPISIRYLIWKPRHKSADKTSSTL